MHRKKLTWLSFAVFILLPGTAGAVPVDYDYMVTVDSAHFETTVLESTFCFDYWFETNAEPGSYVPLEYNFDVLVLQATGTWGFIGQVSAFYSTPDWQEATFIVPDALVGTEKEIRFKLNDYYPDTAPEVYLKGICSEPPTPPIPEPATITLLAGGLAGLTYFWRRRGN